MSVSKTHPDVCDRTPADNAHAPRPLSLAENFVLSLKVLGAVGLVGIALWAAEVWIAGK